MTDDRLLTTNMVAEYLCIQIPALEKWRQLGTGPDYIKVGRVVRYEQSAVDSWLAERTVSTEHKSGLRRELEQ